MAWQVRPAKVEEIGLLMERSVETASNQLMAREARLTSWSQLAGQMQRMFSLSLGAEGGACLLAAEGEVTGGYILLMPAPNSFTGLPELVVMDIWVDPELRGQGLARLLLEGAEVWGRRVGTTGLVAQVAVQNQPSLRTFLKAGYQVERYILGKA